MNTTYSIFDLAPKGADRFHSCIMTGFSFDFNFFDEFILGQLRASGVSNVLVLVDAKILNDSLKYFTSERVLPRSYSVHGVRRAGAFHPKVFALFGEKDGFMAIGSGNPTASGLGVNSEAWSAFHIDGSSDEKYPLFYACWEMLKRLESNVGGESKRRFDWIEASSPWLKKLETGQPKLVKTGDGTEIAFLENSKEPILRSIFDLVPNSIKKITIVSPFFDLDGSLLSTFGTQYSKADFQIVMQTATVVAPKNLDSLLPGRKTIFSWDKMNAEHNSQDKYLHAKIVHFLDNNGMEYLLLGSANFTTAAFGSLNAHSKNDECCVLLKAKGAKYLAKLEIQVEKSFELNQADFETITSSENADKPENGNIWKCFLIGAEKSGQNLTILGHDLKAIAGQRVQVFDFSGDIIADLNLPASTAAESISIAISSEVNIAFVQIVCRKTGSEISNRQLVQDIHTLYKSNPDSRVRRYESILARLNTNDDMVELLSLIDPTELLEKRTAKTESTSSRSKIAAAQPQHKDGRGNILSKEDFQELGNQDRDRIDPFRGYQSSGLSQVFEHLRIISDLTHAQQFDDLTVDEEECDDPSKSQGREDEHNVRRLNSRKEIDRKRGTIDKSFEKYIEVLEKQLEMHHQPGPKDLALYCIMLRLLTHVTERPFEIEEEKKSVPIFPRTGLLYENSFVEVALEIIGKFSLVAQRGFEGIENPKLKEKYNDLGHHALLHSIYCISVFPKEFRDEESVPMTVWPGWIWCLFMNVRQTLGAFADSQTLQEASKYAARRLQIESLNTKVDIAHVVQRLDEFGRWWSVCSTKSGWIRFNEPGTGQKVFIDRFGFCILASNITDESRQTQNVQLGRPGFEWCNEKRDYLSKSRFLTSKARILKIGSKQ